MKRRLGCLSLLVVTLLMLQPAAQAAEATKTALQAFTRRQLANSLVGGQLIFVDFELSKIRTVVPGKSHPDIFYNPKAKLYALCITAIDEKGKNVPVDIYVKDVSGRLTLVDIVFGEQGRMGFMKFVQQGQFKRI